MCTEDSPSGLWRTLGKRVGCKPSGVRIPHPPPPDPGTCPGSGVFVASGVAGVACGAAGVLGAVGPGRPRDRHTRASLGVVDLEARPCPPGPPAPSTPAALVSLELARSGPAPAHRHRGQTLRALRRPPHRRRMWCSVHRPLIGRSRAAEPRPRPLRLRGPRRSLRPGARPGPRPSRTVSSGEGPSRCSSIRPRTPSR